MGVACELQHSLHVPYYFAMPIQTVHGLSYVRDDLWLNSGSV